MRCLSFGPIAWAAWGKGQTNLILVASADDGDEDGVDEGGYRELLAVLELGRHFGGNGDVVNVAGGDRNELSRVLHR